MANLKKKKPTGMRMDVVTSEDRYHHGYHGQFVADHRRLLFMRKIRVQCVSLLLFVFV